MKELAEQKKRYGCRRLHVLVKREGLVDNIKRSERIYKKEGPLLRVRRRRKLASPLQVRYLSEYRRTFRMTSIIADETPEQVSYHKRKHEEGSLWTGL
jgi:hypothetical protein